MLPAVWAHSPQVVAAAAVVVVVTLGIAAFQPSAWAETAWFDLQRAEALARDAAGRIVVWIENGYAKRPAVMLGLATALLLPLLVLLGHLIHRRHSPQNADALNAFSNFSSGHSPRIEIEGAGTIVLPAGRDLLQIGRQQDNDICIEDDGVQHYHAVIERSGEHGFRITDVSGLGGRGLLINGERRLSAVLAHGDRLELGHARLRFATTGEHSQAAAASEVGS